MCEKSRSGDESFGRPESWQRNQEPNLKDTRHKVTMMGPLKLDSPQSKLLACTRITRFPSPKVITLKVLVTTIDAQWEGMGDVGSARHEPTLLPQCPTIRVFNQQ